MRGSSSFAVFHAGKLAHKLQWSVANAMALSFTSPRLLHRYRGGTITTERLVFLRG
jgi:hypothetical protein